VKLSRNGIVLLILLTAGALLGLLVLQWSWMRAGISLNRELYHNRVSLLRYDIEKEMGRHREMLRTAVASVKGRKEIFTGGADFPGLESTVREVVDSIFLRNGLGDHYRLYGQVTDAFCLFHGVKPNPYPSQRMEQADHQVCLCNYTYRGSTIDFIIEFDETPMLFRQFSGLLLPFVLLILLLVGVFAFTIWTIYRQKKLSELKSDFINNLTHEFKTPIFTIGLTSNLLGRSDILNGQPKLREYIDLIRHENLRLKNQVDKVLQMAVIDSGNLALEREVIDLHQLLRKIGDSFRMPVEEKGGCFKLDLQASPADLFADPTHLSNALYNLVDNAYKYTPEKPRIWIGTRKKEKAILIRIADNGIGMSPAVQRQIFERFYRAQRGNRHDVKGFGLGLSYVKSIIEAHDGHIEVESQPGKGTSFTIELPVSDEE
jgi:two-component system phosphate regulon sensor histidine kinase PhoR